jgi:hypothetical protein
MQRKLPAHRALVAFAASTLALSACQNLSSPRAL